MFDKLIDILKANPRRIVFTEGPDARILEAASRLKKDGLLTPVLVGNVEEVKAAAAKGGFDIEGLEIIDPLTGELEGCVNLTTWSSQSSRVSPARTNGWPSNATSRTGSNAAANSASNRSSAPGGVCPSGCPALSSTAISQRASAAATRSVRSSFLMP